MVIAVECDNTRKCVGTAELLFQLERSMIVVVREEGNNGVRKTTTSCQNSDLLAIQKRLLAKSFLMGPLHTVSITNLGKAFGTRTSNFQTVIRFLDTYI